MTPVTQVEGKPRAADVTLSEERLRALFREMLLIRRFEEKVEERFRAGELPGFLHVAIGQEAVASGVCAALEPDDVISSTHRAHAHTIAKGTPVDAIMAEMYGKSEGCSHGYGGSMHLYDVARGNMGANAVVGGGLPQIAGAALAFKLRGEPRVGVSFFGDGATNTGAFHESMNLAQLWKLPMLFVLENNGWAESTPATQQLPLQVEEMGRRAIAYGMTAVEVDGQDVEAVYAATKSAREHAVSGDGPVYMNVRTYRFTGHYVGDPQVYREKTEVRQLWETQDPIELLRARLGMTGEEFERIDADVTTEVERSVEFAKAGTDPDPADALAWVYAEGSLAPDA
jgi:acetoin:2,6-dichlorophenolindophenol oxidoreductase subunit alpha